MGVLAKHKNVENPDVRLTTAHKSKGREFDVVILADDFPSPYNQAGEWIGLQDMERNLLYVALTRTKKVLGYNETVQMMINRCNSQFRYSHEVPSELDVNELFEGVVGKQLRQMDRELQDILTSE